MIDTPRIIETTVQTIAAIHIVVPRAKIREVMGAGHRELLDALAAQHIVPSGPWLTHHLKPPAEIFDYEIAVPVSKRVTEVGRVTNRELPATRCARTIYHGGYEQLGAGWGELEKWIAAQGLQSGPTLWETYLVDPGTNSDPASWQTELTRPLL